MEGIMLKGKRLLINDEWTAYMQSILAGLTPRASPRASKALLAVNKTLFGVSKKNFVYRTTVSSVYLFW